MAGQGWQLSPGIGKHTGPTYCECEIICLCTLSYCQPGCILHLQNANCMQTGICRQNCGDTMWNMNLLPRKSWLLLTGGRAIFLIGTHMVSLQAVTETIEHRLTLYTDLPRWKSFLQIWLCLLLGAIKMLKMSVIWLSGPAPVLCCMDPWAIESQWPP